MRARQILYFGLISLFLNFVVSFLATIIVPYLGFFSFPDLLDSFRLPDFVKRFAGFDGLHYLNIALSGYEKNEVAFFPLYPILIRLLASVPGLIFPIVALSISWISLIASLLILPRYLSLTGLSKNAKWFIIFLLTFPTSFFLQSAYSESLFIVLVLLCLFTNKGGNFWASALFAYLAGATRVVGIFLVIPLLFSGARRRLSLLLAPMLGFISYAGYLWFTTGDGLKFFHVQSQFGAGRTTKVILLPQVLYRYLRIFLTADLTYTYFISVVEFSIFIFVLSILLFDLYKIIKKKAAGNLPDRLGLNLFGLTMLVFPTVTGTLLSIPRFVLPILTLYLVLSEINNLYFKIVIAGFFAILHVILLMFFIQGYFVA